MIRFMKAALRGVKNELAVGESGWVNLSAALPWSWGGKTSAAGKVVNVDSALCTSAAFDCTRKTSEVVSTLPFKQYEKQPDGTRIEIQDELSDILAISPNTDQTAVEFWESNVAQMVLRGNAINEKLFIKNRLVGLRPILSASPERQSDGSLKYAVWEGGRKEYMPKEKIFHLRGFGLGDGLGLSAIKYGANSIGATLAADETTGSLFSNAMMASGVIQSDQTLTTEQRTQLQTMLSAYTGSDKAGKIMTLEAGLSYKQMQMNPEDAQLIETRLFNVEDVCRWFGVPPIIVGHSQKGQTMWGSGVEAILLSWLTLGINPLLKRIEARTQKDLVPVEHRRRRYFEYTREAMIQMDSKAKGDFMMKMRFGGYMTGDEGRDKINLPRRGGQSDELYIQSSMTPVELIGKDDQK
jgi:HK97 family phage portal protein